MPPDINKRLPRGQPTTKPTAPQLAKTASYVAPRLAGSPASSPDLSRKQQGNNRAQNNTARNDAPSPIRAPLSSSATPRSGARKTRAESISSTPNGTPTSTPASSRPMSMVAGKDVSSEKGTGSGIGIHGVGLYPHSRSGSVTNGIGGVSSFLRSLSPERQPPRPTSGTHSAPMFFHASDAQTASPRPSSNISTHSKPQAFFYANGEQEAIAEPPAPAVVAPSLPAQPKFFHANGVPETKSVPDRAQSTPSPSVSRSSPRPGGQTPLGRSIVPRSPSPLKEFEAAIPSVQSPARSVPAPSTPSVHHSAWPFNPDMIPVQRSSAQPPGLGLLHKKSASLTSIGSPELRRSDLPFETHGRISDTSSSFVSEPESLEAPAAQVDATAFPPLSPGSPLVSPSHSVLGAFGGLDPSHQTKIEQAQALAAQARRERKVLDLEISNSSLLAINRTLEREMRKQKAELRRYRRLTSSGRISLPPVTGEGRPSLTDTLSSGLSPIEGSDDDDFRSNDDEEEDDEEDFSSLSSCTSSSTSPNSAHAPSARQRERDAKRLRLDLARHRALLEDSQALNQSLKRCLGRTEALIMEGRRALDHRVRASEVHIGGRVLAADEVAGDVELGESRGLLSPGLENGSVTAEYRWEEPAAQEPAPSPKSPFSGFMPFVRQLSAEKIFGASSVDPRPGTTVAAGQPAAFSSQTSSQMARRPSLRLDTAPVL